MKQILSTLIAVVFTASAFAQQDPQFSQYMFNKLATNPAVAGSNDAICATLIYRNQWVGFDGAPKTGMLNLDAPVAAVKGGLGLTIGTDKIGLDESFIARISYAYRMNLGQGKLGLGLSAGLLQHSLDGASFVFVDQGDQSIPTSKVSASAPDFGFGVYYHTNNLYLGLSSSHLSEGELKFTDKAVSTISRHYYLNAGYSMEVSPSLAVKPSVLVKSDGSTTQLDINANVLYNNLIWGGVSYRLTDAIIGMVGMNLTDQLKFGYSYDMTTSALNRFSSGSHEIMLGYCFKPKTTRPIIMNRNVRFL